MEYPEGIEFNFVVCQKLNGCMREVKVGNNKKDPCADTSLRHGFNDLEVDSFVVLNYSCDSEG
jgi:hypothetical protein